jgi:formylglycine-generating enzyme required for sulfatase activity
MSNPGSIFISYRRSDSIAETGRIYDRLVTEFGRDHVFKDVDSLPFGVDFAEYLDQAVSECQVVLVVIGKSWSTVTEADGSPRLQNPDDFVRIEVESALKRGIPVIPVLLEGASMPKRNQLPESLHTLCRRNGTQVGYDPRFHADMGRLVKGIQGLLRVAEEPSVVEALVEEPPTQPIELPPKEATPLEPSPLEIDLGEGVTLDLVRIPGGTFLMGSPEDEKDRADREGPQHKVTVPTFYMGKYPVTQAQYQAIMGKNPSRFKGDDLPVETVSWADAVEFCARLTKKTGNEYRLPSEAEWEYACRAGTTTPYYFGGSITTDQVNHNSHYKQTTKVGRFPPNPFGLYDMHGNVFDWCQDVWHDNYQGAPTDGTAWLDGGSQNLRIRRGGSWFYFPRHCRSACRYYFTPVSRNDFIGFRVCCSAPRTL